MRPLMITQTNIIICLDGGVKQQQQQQQREMSGQTVCNVTLSYNYLVYVCMCLSFFCRYMVLK